MQKNVASAIGIIAVFAIGVFLIVRYTSHKKAADDTPFTDHSQVIVPSVSNDIVWNAYTVGGVVFIYPSDWTFTEILDPKTGKPNSFSVEYPVSSNSADKIEVVMSCPEVMIPEIHTACIKNVWLHTQSENEAVLKMFNDMKTFAEAAVGGH